MVNPDLSSYTPSVVPQWPIIGHHTAVAQLAHSVAAQRPSHAYLLAGPPQIGKTTLALAFAQALNCSTGPYPCGECRACANIARGSHPDVRLVTGDNGVIKVDHIRALQRELALSPYEGRWRIAILSNIELATIEACNSLLKTLEEPPAQAVLVLTAIEPSLLLPTIVSRCQQVSLHPLPSKEVEVALHQRWKADKDRAQLLARLSSGRIGWAVEANRDHNTLTRRGQRLDQLIALSGANRVNRLSFAEQAARRPDDLPALLEEWLVWWRDVLLVLGGNPDAVTNVDRQGQLEQLAQHYSLAQISSIIHELQTTLLRLEQNVNPRLAMEVLLLHLPVGR
jgi:DNA polymerase III subunit delta'